MKYTIKLGRLMRVETFTTDYGGVLKPSRCATIVRCNTDEAVPGSHTNRTYYRVTLST